MSIKRAWERRRRDVIARDGRRCTQCGKAAALEVHHLVGSLRQDLRRGQLSPVEDLTSLCRGCHAALHHPPDPERVKWIRYIQEKEMATS